MPRYNEYKDECGSCESFFQMRGNWDIPYDINDTVDGYCNFKKMRRSPSDSCSYHFERGAYHSSCFITTVVCKILGYDDNCFALESLRGLRDDFMQPNEKYKEDLFEYDTVGPQIATILGNDYKETKDDTVARNLYLTYILPASIEAKQDKPNNAITIYKRMTNMLKETYNIKSNEELLKEYDQSKGGHGHLRVLKIKAREK